MDSFRKIRGFLNDKISIGSRPVKADIIVGTGDPEGNIAADKSSMFHRTDAVANDEFVYIKTTNNSDSGWIKIAGGSAVYQKVITKEVSYDNMTIDKFGNRYIKTAYCMFTEDHKPSPDYTKVYKDNVLMTYNTEWVFGDKRSGGVTSLIDNVRIISPQSGSTYKLEYTENQVLYQPEIKMWANSNRKNKRISQRIYLPDMIHRLIWSVTKSNEWEYTVEYRSVDGKNPVIVLKTFSNNVRFKEFDVNIDMSPWRMETYRLSKAHNSGWDNASPGAKTDLIPKFVSANNLFNIPSTCGSRARYVGEYYFKLRNVDTNTVTGFSQRHLSVRRLGVFQPNPSGDIYLGLYWMPEII